VALATDAFVGNPTSFRIAGYPLKLLGHGSNDLFAFSGSVDIDGAEDFPYERFGL
jgi:hypothetical protein